MLPAGGGRRGGGRPGPQVCGALPRLPASLPARARSVRCTCHSGAAGPQERIRLYEQKVQKLESEKWLHENSAQTQVNVAAANRFISAAIPDLTPVQRQALKAVRTNWLTTGP